MAQRKTLTEQIALAKEDIKQQENKLKLLNQRQKEQERKDRTRRLIERGAILESLIDGAATRTNEEIQTLIQKIFATPYAKQMLTAFTPRAAAETEKTATTETE